LDIRIRLQTQYPAGYPTGKPDSDHLWILFNIYRATRHQTSCAVKCHILALLQHSKQPFKRLKCFTGCVSTTVERIEDFCDPIPVQNFHCVIQSDPNPAVLSKYLIQCGLYPKKTLIKDLTAVISAFGYPFHFNVHHCTALTVLYHNVREILANADLLNTLSVWAAR